MIFPLLPVQYEKGDGRVIFFTENLPGILKPDRILTMKIRAITCFIDPSFPVQAAHVKKAGDFLKVAQKAFIEGGYEVETFRLASVPFPMLLPEFEPGRLAEFARQLERMAGDEGYTHISLGPALPVSSESYRIIPEALAATQNAFFSGSMTTKQAGVSLAAVHECARVIQQASKISPDGFGNLRFAALANVPAGSPFLPAAYHLGGDIAFAIATEAADLAVTAFSQVTSLEEGRRRLIKSIETHAHSLAGVAQLVEKRSHTRFGGIDFSLAPFPEAARSLGSAMERLGVPEMGMHGSLAAAAMLADTVDRAEFRRTGFSGLFFPVLEDAVLAHRAAEGSLGVKDLLLYTAVCGTGLDCIPLPGDTSVEQLSAVLLDLASLSTRLGKPLTARLMPIPNKKVGDPTDFDFSYFANSRVLPLSAQPLSGLLNGDETFDLRQRRT